MQRLHGFVLYFGVTLLLLLGLAGALQAEWAYAAPVASQSTATPVPLPPHPVLSDIVALQPMGHYTCALTSGGTVKCWGGFPNLAAANPITIPTVGPGLEQGVQALSNGVGAVQCAVMTDGTARCGTGLGELVTIGFATAVRSVASGGPLCALLVNGAVQCVGNNEYGQLGNGSFSLREEQPVNVKGLTGTVEAVVNGSAHSCALLSGGQVQCWGHKDMLGSNATAHSSQPVQVSGLISGVVALTAGGSFTCALLADGSVRCWGDITERLSDDRPVTITGLPAKAKAIDRFCALLVNNAVACYGDEIFSGFDYYFPQWGLFEGFADGATALSLALSTDRGCALVAGGRVQCWGANQGGQLATGRATYRTIPFTVQGLVSGTQAVSAGEYRSCATASPDSIYCWGQSVTQVGFIIGYGDPKLPYKVANLGSDIKKIRQDVYHGCALLANGGVRCWGWKGTVGNLVPLTVTNAISIYEPVGLGSGVVDLDTGGDYSCAVLGNGEVQCWGSSGLNQIFDTKSFTTHLTPVAVPGLNVTASAVTGGVVHTCILAQNQEVFCWGRNGFGQTGNGQIGNGISDLTHVAPSKVLGLPAAVVAISAGHYHTCALLSTGGMKCWGANFNGQLGNGNLVDQGTAVDVIGLSSGVQALDLGNRHSCALLTNGGVKCWGANPYGGLGNGTTTDQNVPVAVTGLTAGVKEISAGADHTCALLTTGTIKCFGPDGAGQLGQGEETVTQIPRYVLTGFVPQLRANFTDTQSGGVIALTGEHFPPSQTLLIRVNDVVYGAVQSSVLGELFFLVDTQAASASSVRIQVGETTQTLSIGPTAPLRQAEGGGTTIRLSSAFQPFYLPLLMQNE